MFWCKVCRWWNCHLGTCNIHVTETDEDWSLQHLLQAMYWSHARTVDITYGYRHKHSHKKLDLQDNIYTHVCSTWIRNYRMEPRLSSCIISKHEIAIKWRAEYGTYTSSSVPSSETFHSVRQPVNRLLDKSSTERNLANLLLNTDDSSNDPVDPVHPVKLFLLKFLHHLYIHLSNPSSCWRSKLIHFIYAETLLFISCVLS